jgi:hypothetical protein
MSRPLPPSRRPAPIGGTSFAALLLACGSWLTLFYLVQNVLPHAGARWLFFVLLYMAVAGTSIPFLKLLNWRLHREGVSPPDWVSVRQGLWIGLYVTTCLWLQIPRVLNPPIAAVLAMSLMVIEAFIRFREYY